jgi:hypothetical protein
MGPPTSLGLTRDQGQLAEKSEEYLAGSSEREWRTGGWLGAQSKDR